MEREAAAREVSVQQHIYDLLIARHFARQGQAMGDLLWVPQEGASELVEEEPAPASAAAGAASAWLEMLDE
jgi:hypothetical protein